MKSGAKRIILQFSYSDIVEYLPLNISLVRGPKDKMTELENHILKLTAKHSHSGEAIYDENRNFLLYTGVLMIFFYGYNVNIKNEA